MWIVATTHYWRLLKLFYVLISWVYYSLVCNQGNVLSSYIQVNQIKSILLRSLK